MLIEIKERPNAYRPSQPCRILALRCDTCGTGFEKAFTQHYLDRHKWGHFCSRRCYGAFRSAHSELYAETTALMHAPKVAKKISEVRLEQTSQPGYVHPWTGRHHTEETKEQIKAAKALNPQTGERNGMWGRKHEPETRSKMSEAKTRLILEGKFRPYGTRNVKGHHTSTRDGKERYFKSSWERAVMEHLDVSPEVAAWDYECVRIPYYYDNNKRWYVPDFLVTFADGRRELWEVKPKEFVNTEKSRLKSEAASAWCAANFNITHLVFTKTELRQMGVL